MCVCGRVGVLGANVGVKEVGVGVLVARDGAEEAAVEVSTAASGAAAASTTTDADADDVVAVVGAARAAGAVTGDGEALIKDAGQDIDSEAR